MIKLTDLIRICGVNPSDYKVHLASRGEGADPLDAFLAGTFKSWQEQQTKRNFSCEHVISLIQIGPKKWLFAGVWKIEGISEKQGGTKNQKNTHVVYKTSEVNGLESLCGRVIVHHDRNGVRNSYRRGAEIEASIVVSEMLPERMSVGAFPGFSRINLSHSRLKILAEKRPAEWISALKSVAGIYVIADSQSGKLYIGSAQGGAGIWGRWNSYAETGHGNNTELRQLLLAEGGISRAEYFTYSVLEICDLISTTDEILSRENHWKTILQTRDFGLNSN